MWLACTRPDLGNQGQAQASTELHVTVPNQRLLKCPQSTSTPNRLKLSSRCCPISKTVHNFDHEEITSSKSSKRPQPPLQDYSSCGPPSAGSPEGLMQFIRCVTIQAARMMTQGPSFIFRRPSRGDEHNDATTDLTSLTVSPPHC